MSGQGRVFCNVLDFGGCGLVGYGMVSTSPYPEKIMGMV